MEEDPQYVFRFPTPPDAGGWVLAGVRSPLRSSFALRLWALLPRAWALAALPTHLLSKPPPLPPLRCALQSPRPSWDSLMSTLATRAGPRSSGASTSGGQAGRGGALNYALCQVASVLGSRR